MYTLNTPPKPVAAVGMSIRVMGRVTAQKQGRFITADTISQFFESLCYTNM